MATSRQSATAAPNYNQVSFPPLVAQQFRVLLTPTATFAVGVKEFQAFDLDLDEVGLPGETDGNTGDEDDAVAGSHQSTRSGRSRRLVGHVVRVDTLRHLESGNSVVQGGPS